MHGFSCPIACGIFPRPGIELTSPALEGGFFSIKAAIKTAERNINNLRYTDDTTLLAESKEELKSLLMKENWLKTQHLKN